MEKQENLENKLFWIDNLRAVATIAVIILHSSASTALQFGIILNFNWWMGNIFDSAVRFSVPIFVMITGALLLPRNYEIADFLKRRLFRVVYPFVFWSLFYILFKLSIKIFHGEPLFLLNTIKFIFLSLQKGSSLHFWYIYMILGIYLFIPIIGKWARNSSEKEIKYFLIIWVFTLILNQPIFLNYKPDINLTYFSGYIGYLVLGYYLTIKNLNIIKRVKVLSVCFICFGILITILGTYFFSKQRGVFVDYFYNYLTINVLIVSIGVFLFVKNYNISNTKLKHISKLISKYSYGIYLVHVFFLGILSKVGINSVLINPLIGIPITTFLCLGLSTYAIFLINKLPYGKYISG